MHRFVYGLGIHLAGDFTLALLNKEMDISRLMTYAQQREDLKKRTRADRERNRNKRATLAGNNDRNTARNFFNRISADRSPSTASAPPPRYSNERRGQNGQSQNSRAPSSPQGSIA
ncbi:hypothetical protein HAX54_034971, partial [Datura stramonium]|nr:hypothetical protein [Datura stramonium]